MGGDRGISPKITSWSGYNICVEVGGELSISIKWNGHSQTKNPVPVIF